ncbi:MAG: hypothetical protein ABW292_12095 [Vicinamibacterales bacterium]
MKTLLAIGMLAFVAPLAGGETRLGTGVTLKDSTPIKSILEQPATYVGKTIRIDGVATAVCAHMGCWMAVAAEGPVGNEGPGGNVQAPTIRLKVDDGVIVFPVSAKGRKVSAEGVFEALGGAGDSRDAAQEHAKDDPTASQSYQLKATGAIIQ